MRLDFITTNKSENIIKTKHTAFTALFILAKAICLDIFFTYRPSLKYIIHNTPQCTHL